jgi:hypothetical protein
MDVITSIRTPAGSWAMKWRCPNGSLRSGFMIALQNGDVDGRVLCRLQSHLPIAFECGFEAEIADVKGSNVAGLNDGIELGAFHEFHPSLKKHTICMYCV